MTVPQYAKLSKNFYEYIDHESKRSGYAHKTIIRNIKLHIVKHWEYRRYTKRHYKTHPTILAHLSNYPNLNYRLYRLYYMDHPTRNRIRNRDKHTKTKCLAFALALHKATVAQGGSHPVSVSWFLAKGCKRHCCCGACETLPKDILTKYRWNSVKFQPNDIYHNPGDYPLDLKLKALEDCIRLRLWNWPVDYTNNPEQSIQMFCADPYMASFDKGKTWISYKEIIGHPYMFPLFGTLLSHIEEYKQLDNYDTLLKMTRTKSDHNHNKHVYKINNYCKRLSKLINT